MPATALVQTRIDPEIRDRASEVLAKSGLTVSDVTRIVLTRIANEGFVSPGLVAPDDQYDAWLRAKVQEALDNKGQRTPNDEVKAEFAAYKAELRARLARGER